MKKPVSMTVNGCAVIVALLAWLDTAIGRTPAPVGYLKAHFGAVGDGIADDTGAVTAFLEACRQQRCHAERGRYRVTARLPVIDSGITLAGDGIDVTEFIRDFDESEGRGFLHFENARSGHGSSLSGFSIHSAAGRRGGHAIAGVSRPGSVFGNMRIEHVKLSTEGSNSWHSTVLFSGLANTGGARGARAISMASCLVFGADGYSIVLEGVAGFSFVGGGTYAAGGTNPLSGAIRVAGSSDFKATGVLLIGDHFGMLHLRHVLGMKVIVASGIAGSLIDGEHVAINADETVDRVQILGEPFGVTRTSWVNSSIVMPDGSIRR